MDDNQRNEIIVNLLKEKKTLSEIQDTLKNEHHVNMTFMELRILSSELEIDWSQFDPEPEPEEEKDDDNKETPAEEKGAKVEISKIVRPGTAMSGSVIFESGIKGEWHIDTTGRLGLNLEDETKQPTPEDMQDFQTKLQKLVQG